MFKRVILEDWHSIVPYVCFGLIAGAFVLIVIFALRMKRKDVDHMASLPLENDEDLMKKQIDDEK